MGYKAKIIMCNPRLIIKSRMTDINQPG